MRSGVEELGVMLDVLVHEGAHEVVAVVVALQEKRQRPSPENQSAAQTSNLSQFTLIPPHV